MIKLEIQTRKINENVPKHLKTKYYYMTHESKKKSKRKLGNIFNLIKIKIQHAKIYLIKLKNP